MKTLSTILFISSFALSISASPKCERLELYDFANLRESFEHDLMSGVWRTNLLGITSTLYFQADGMVISIPVNQERVETYLWSVNVEEDQAILSLLGPDTDRKFFIAPTCSGISAVAGGRATQMTALDVKLLTEAERGFIQIQLAGTWDCNIRKSHRAKASDFSISLHQDGSFAIQTNPDPFHSSHDGLWQLSPDGQYLILHLRVLIGSHAHFVTEYLNLKSVDFEDMVIGAEILPRVLNAHHGKDLLYLEKVKASS